MYEMEGPPPARRPWLAGFPAAAHRVTPTGTGPPSRESVSRPARRSGVTLGVDPPQW